jgi:hypothetical protein
MKMITSERHEGQEMPGIERKEHQTGKEGSERVKVAGKRVMVRKPSSRFGGRFGGR